MVSPTAWSGGVSLFLAACGMTMYDTTGIGHTDERSMP